EARHPAGQARGPRFRPGGLPTRGIAVVERPSEEVGRHASSGEWQGQAEAREPRPQERSRGEATAGEQQQRVERAARPGEIGVPREERVRARIREERQEGLSTGWSRCFTSDSFSCFKKESVRREKPMAVREEVLQANRSYSESFDKGELPIPPGRRFAVVTCMDARL